MTTPPFHPSNPLVKLIPPGRKSQERVVVNVSRCCENRSHLTNGSARRANGRKRPCLRVKLHLIGPPATEPHEISNPVLEISNLIVVRVNPANLRAPSVRPGIRNSWTASDKSSRRVGMACIVDVPLDATNAYSAHMAHSPPSPTRELAT